MRGKGVRFLRIRWGSNSVLFTSPFIGSRISCRYSCFRPISGTAPELEGYPGCWATTWTHLGQILLRSIELLPHRGKGLGNNARHLLIRHCCVAVTMIPPRQRKAEAWYRLVSCFCTIPSAFKLRGILSRGSMARCSKNSSKPKNNFDRQQPPLEYLSTTPIWPPTTGMHGSTRSST